MKIRFGVKDFGRRPLIAAVCKMLEQDAAYGGLLALSYSAGGYIVRCATRRTFKKGADFVNIRFNVASAGRRAFAQAVGEITGNEVVYGGTPGFAYIVGDYVVDREGALVCPNGAGHREINRLLAALNERGYDAEDSLDYHALQMTEREELGLGRERHDYPGEDGMQASDVPETDDNNKLVIEMPDISIAALSSLRKIIASKDTLFKKAFGAEDLPVEAVGNKIRFPWFTLTGEDGEVDAYLRFVAALCQMAKTKKRITAKERDVENDKFTMRLFLVRLGFVGPENKAARSILLRNLTGNSAWKNGQPPVTIAMDAMEQHNVTVREGAEQNGK